MTTLRLFRPAVAQRATENLIDWTNLMDRFFENDNRLDYRCAAPKANILEFEDHYRIDLYVPGVAKEDVKIELENDRLVISKEGKNEAENESYRLKEFGCDAFERAFTLSKDIDSSKISASHENGILSVSLPRREDAKPVKRVVDIQ